jgi:hypothetical protein
MRLILFFLFLCLTGSVRSQIVLAEYFYNDASVRYGHGTKLTVPANSGSTEISASLDISSLNPGFNQVYFRVKDSGKGWSSLTPKVFFKKWTKDTLTGFKYCIDPQLEDAEWHSVAFSNPSSDVSETKEISLGDISFGIHFIEIMASTKSGVWTPVTKGTFFNLLSEPANIVKLEYFFEDEGVPSDLMVTSDFTPSPSVTLDSLSFAIPAGSLDDSKLYTINIRGVNELGDKGFYYCDTIVYHAPAGIHDCLIVGGNYILYPNPAADFINIRLLNKLEGKSLLGQILNSSGETVRTVDIDIFDGFVSVDITALPIGSYVFVLTNDGGEPIGNIKFVKND